MKHPLELRFEPMQLKALLENRETQDQVSNITRGLQFLDQNPKCTPEQITQVVSKLQDAIYNLYHKTLTPDTLGYYLGPDIKISLDQLSTLLNQREFYKAVFKLVLDKFETTRHNYESILPYTHNSQSKELQAYTAGIQEVNAFIFNREITSPAIKKVFELEDYLTLLKFQLPKEHTTGILTIQEDPLRIVVEGPVSPKPNGGLMVPKHICLAEINVTRGYAGSISIPVGAWVQRLVVGRNHATMVHFGDPEGRMACQFS